MFTTCPECGEIYESMCQPCWLELESTIAEEEKLFIGSGEDGHLLSMMEFDDNDL